MKTVIKVLYYISAAVFMCSGAFCTVPEFMPDVSVIPQAITNAVMISGLICLAYAAAYYLTKKRRDRPKPKIRR